MKTTFAKKTDIDRKWYLIDAKDQTVGRLATQIANILRGKNKPIFSPHVDCGDFVVVINASEVKFSGNKEEQKLYYSHSGFPGALKSKTAAKLRTEKPTKILELAVRGMIPGNKLRKPIMSKLKLFPGEEHNHEAQKPEKIEM